MPTIKYQLLVVPRLILFPEKRSEDKHSRNINQTLSGNIYN